MNRRNFFTMAAQFVLGCAIGIKASREIETMPVISDKALFGTWRFIVPAKEMTYWSFQAIEPNWHSLKPGDLTLEDGGLHDS